MTDAAYYEALAEWKASMSTSPRPARRPDGIPTRCDLQWMTAAEKAITEAIEVVEKAGASEALTKAVNLLGEARDCVANHVEAVSA